MNAPAIGFGTAPYRDGQAPLDFEEPVRLALQAGCRMFDFAEGYGNERAIGRALHSSVAPSRGDLYLIGKVWRTNFRPDRLRRACEASLRRLGVDSFDLYLLHAPGALRYIAPLEGAEEIGWDELVRRAMPRNEAGELIADDVPLSETWEAMRGLVSAGLTAQIGVSNFSIGEIESLGPPRPAANQVPCWPVDASALDAHHRQEIMVIGYSPLKREILDDPLTKTIASKHQRTAAQIVLRWLIACGVRPLTSSTNANHIRENLDAVAAELDSSDASALAERHGL